MCRILGTDMSYSLVLIDNLQGHYKRSYYNKFTFESVMQRFQKMKTRRQQL
ncbi:hypothetical protein HanIR_Chr03g0146721 [Helianthus annuus]|nr:hypothetical protein HanIR_Chr03g0146721 [Helianthus annuus]